MTNQPVTVYSNSETGAKFLLPWEEVENELVAAQMYWIMSFHDDIPHSVPVIGVWFENALYSCNPRSEQKYKNFQKNANGQALIGGNELNKGLNIAVNGIVEEMTEMEDRLRFGRQMAEKYPQPWRFEGTEQGMWVYRLVPTHVRAFHRMNPLASARFNFDGETSA